MKDSIGILGNDKSKNHFKEILKLSKESDELILVSPFFTKDIGFFLENMETIQKLTIYTVFEGYNDALNKADSVHELYRYCESNNIKLSVKFNDDLHGKVYLFYKNDKERGAIVTSANFTSKGLINNYEWGISINDNDKQKLLRSEIEEMTVYELNKHQIEAIHKSAIDFKKNNPIPKENVFKINKYINVKPSKNGNIKMGYYLKPIGVTGNPFKKGDTLKENDEIGFGDSANKLNKGDILFCHSVGTGFLVGYYKISSDSSEFKEINKDDRWPWKVSVECYSIPFSKEWWVYEMKTNDLVSEFKKLYPDKHITYNGGDTLGALKWGRDRIRLTEQFAIYLIEEIDKNWKS
ncbi:restriction endonuclease PLD domain-containing protein [Clostridium chromiireducens]|nr:restriction endonuclease PLD domain-containing protein [Clostridium chromiireducens]